MFVKVVFVLGQLIPMLPPSSGGSPDHNISWAIQFHLFQRLEV